MAIIVVDSHYLPRSPEPLVQRMAQRVRRIVASLAPTVRTSNRSPFPDRVWARHSALLSAAREQARSR